MDIQKISLDAIRTRKVGILGYGNQGHAHALNLRDSGVPVVVGAREGQGRERARADGFVPVSLAEAAHEADVVMFLLPDQVIPALYGELLEVLKRGGKRIGFSHGFALTFGRMEILKQCEYFLVSPKGAGAVLRKAFSDGKGLPGVYALGPNATEETRQICLSYAKAVGLAYSCLIETTVREETVTDLFGEQVVLCGGIPRLMEMAFDTLVEKGMSRQMAFFECCYEARLILELWMRFGPHGMTQKISPTAFFGGLTRGQRIVPEETRREMGKIFDEISSGEFAREWMQEVQAGTPRLKEESARLSQLGVEEIYEGLASKIS